MYQRPLFARNWAMDFGVGKYYLILLIKTTQQIE